MKIYKLMESQRKFYEKVDLRSRTAMIDFLSNHFRYDTMNSWNLSTSYANNLKIHNVIPNKLQDVAYEMVFSEAMEEAYDCFNFHIQEFDSDNNKEFQAGFNGRSGGYLVLYRGGYNIKTLFEFENGEDSDYEDGYGWMSKEEAIKKGLYKKKVKKVFSYPGKSIDQDEDFKNWDMYELKSRVKLVQKFDKLCDNIVAEMIYLCENYTVEEEVIAVQKTIKVLKEK